jgi:hypothetical protein
MADERFSSQPDIISCRDADETLPDLSLALGSSTTSDNTMPSRQTTAVWPPPYPLYRRRETISPAMLLLIISLVTLLIAGGLSLVIYSATEQYHSSLKAQASLDAQGLCCKNAGRDAKEMKAHLLFSLGRHSKEAGDEGDLSCDVPFFHTVNLSLANHVHHLVALQGSPRCLEGKEAHPWLDTPFDEAVILLDEII